MTTVTIQQAFEACQTNKNTWLKRKAELADLEREYREQLLAGDEQ
ncbi:Polarity suppression protein, partial [Citrobacter sp. Cpo109]